MILSQLKIVFFFLCYLITLKISILCNEQAIYLLMNNSLIILSGATLKGQSNEIFDLQFFSSFEPALATDQLF